MKPKKEVKMRYNVNVVVTITLNAENQNDACEQAKSIVANCLDGKTNNNCYPDWIMVTKADYSI